MLLQMKFLLLMNKDNFKALYSLKNLYDRLAMTDLAYNAGPGRVTKDRRQCGLTKGCDAQIWFGHVEHTCTASKKPIYGNRSACDISREHPHNLLKVRNFKYKPLMR